MQNVFVTSVGYILGILIILVIAGVCLKPVKFIIRVFLNSVLGGALIWIINFLGAGFGVHIGLNPVTSVAVGALGVPGVIIILILQIIY